MLKINKDQKRLPVGGHHYIEYGKTFKGESVDEIEEQISAFRLANNIPAGNPKQEILAFYAKNWPWMVKEDREAVETISDEDYIAWREWVYSTWKNPPKLRKSRWESTDESSELVRRAYLLRRGIEVPINLTFCSCHRADLGVLVLTEQAKSYSARKDVEQPVNCWI